MSQENELDVAVSPDEKFELIQDKISKIDYSSARDHVGEINKFIADIRSVDKSFAIFCEELGFEGLKLFDQNSFKNQDYSYVNEKGIIVSKDNQEKTFPSNIDFMNAPAVRLAALKYYGEIKKSGKTYEYGNIAAYSARLNEDLKEVLLEQKRLLDEQSKRDQLVKKNFENEREEHRAVIHKEVVNTFKESGLPLNMTISEMLMEPDSMQYGRKGSGFTNVFRELGTYINNPIRNPLDLFDEYEVEKIFDENKDRKISKEEKIEKLGIKEKLAEISKKLTNPSHVILIKMIHDIALGSEADLPSLPIASFEESEKAGTCTTAERYYFEFSGIKQIENFKGGYDGHMKIICDENNKPVLLEKVGMGNESCISLVPLKIGQVEIPAGSMLQVMPKEGAVSEKVGSKYFPEKLKLSDYVGFRFLRISTLSLDPQNRAEAFGNHYYQQGKDDFVNYDWLETRHYLELAENALKNNS